MYLETEKIWLTVPQRYAFFICGLFTLTILPSIIRPYYLWLGTIGSIFYSIYKNELTPHICLISLSGIMHSFCHVIYPFLDEVQGFNPEISAFPDVFFHTIMLWFMWYSMKSQLVPSVNYITIFCVAGGVLNCILTRFKTTQTDSYANLLLSDGWYALFVITTVFQAISTAYWIACCLHYKEWNDILFSYGLLGCLTVIVSNWAWYQMDDIFDLGIGLVRMSMKYRYIEGLFIICTWVPLVFSKKLSKEN